MKLAIATLLILILLPCPLLASSSVPLITLKTTHQKYQYISQIEAILVNKSDRSIYLNPYANGSASPYVYNPSTNNWESGIGPCATEINPRVIEVKANEGIRIGVQWGLSLPESGKFKLVLEYSLEIWKADNPPSKIYTVESNVFRITKRVE